MSRSAQAMIQLLDEVARTRGRLRSAFGSVRMGRGLSDAESVVMSAVVRAQRPPTVSQIGRSLGHPRQVIQRAADGLAARGLITFEDNPDHKRARLLQPTDTGRELQAEGDNEGLARADLLAQGLDSAEIERTVAGLRAIRTTIERNLRATNQGEHG